MGTILFFTHTMKKLLIVASLMLLASCGAGNTTQTGTTDTGSTAVSVTLVEGTGAAVEPNAYVSLYYTLRENDANGAIIDTNIIEDAIAAGKASSGETLPTLDVTMGAGQLIVGFEEELMNMRAGGRKHFTVSPEKGYGTGVITHTVALAEIAPKFERTFPQAYLRGVITQTFNKSDFPEHMLAELNAKKIGDTLIGANGQEGKIIAVTDTTATIEFHHENSPFYDKEFAENAEGTLQGITYKILKLEGDNAVVEIINPESPFANKEFAIGSTVENTIQGLDGTQKTVSIKVVNIEGDTVTIEQTNTHHLANKTLHFTVHVVNVIPPTQALPMPVLQEDITHTMEETDNAAQ